LGFMRSVPMGTVLAFLPFVIAGFLINLATGIEFFVTDPFMYWPNPAFRLKLALIVLAGLNALLFTVLNRRHRLVLADGKDPSAYVRLTAGLSLSLWLCVLLLGRLLPAFEGSTSFL